VSAQQKIIMFLFAVILLSPLGLITQSPAWGEWSEEELKAMIGFVPKGISEGELFKAPFADYSFLPLGEIGGYIFSATLGSILVIAVFYALKKLVNAQK
jgi:hypothetical protein